MEFKFLVEKIILLFLLLFSGIIYAQSTLKSVHFSSKNNKSELVAILSKPTTYHVFSLANPQRIVLDFDKTNLRVKSLKEMLQRAKLIVPEITNIRVGYPRKKVLRIVLDLDRSVNFRVFSLAANKKIILQLISINKKITAKHLPDSQSIVVVIDPGHGGKDPGASGMLGSKEKNIVLAIARKLAKEINQTPNMRAVLTRNGDYFVPLRGRLRLARRGKADVFVAIHADSWFNRRANGASVYALSQHGATSEAAHWLAGRENMSELAGVNAQELQGQSYLLRSVLIDLEQTATIRDSLHLGRSLLADLHAVTSLHYRRVEQAPFMVLKSPDIPSVLVETGFLSNKQEELHLRDPVYQGKIARAILIGLQKYIKKYPPAVV